MLNFAYKKFKKHQVEKKAEARAQRPLITEEDENFLTRIVSAEGTPPPLPGRPQRAEVIDRGDDHQNDPVTSSPIKGKENVEPVGSKQSHRFSFLGRGNTTKEKLRPNAVVSPSEAIREENDINRVLDDLDLAAVNNRAFSISKESQEIVQKFTVILKDIVNGVPTAYDDLVHLLDDSNGTLSKSYEQLPRFLKKLIKQLPNRMTKYLGPELLAVATEAQAFRTGSSKGGGLSGAAKNIFKMGSLKDLVAKPGAVVSLLKTIMNALKLRWPAFMGTNVLLSLALFVLLFFFWYCHKRGRETRLKKERMVDSEGRITELADDPLVEGAGRSPGESGNDSRKRDPERDRANADGLSASHEHGPKNGATTPTRK